MLLFLGYQETKSKEDKNSQLIFLTPTMIFYFLILQVFASSLYMELIFKLQSDPQSSQISRIHTINIKSKVKLSQGHGAALCSSPRSNKHLPGHMEILLLGDSKSGLGT